MTPTVLLVAPLALATTSTTAGVPAASADAHQPGADHAAPVVPLKGVFWFAEGRTLALAVERLAAE